MRTLSESPPIHPYQPQPSAPLARYHSTSLRSSALPLLPFFLSTASALLTSQLGSPPRSLQLYPFALFLPFPLLPSLSLAYPDKGDNGNLQQHRLAVPALHNTTRPLFGVGALSCNYTLRSLKRGRPDNTHRVLRSSSSWAPAHW